MNDNFKRKIIYAIGGIGVIVLIFAAYRILYMAGISDYAKEFTAGCIGAVITIFATAALLKSQTDSEVTKDQLQTIFVEKMALYGNFIEFLNDIHNDNVIEQHEINKMIEWGAKLSLICKPSVIAGIYRYLFQIIAFGTDNYWDLTSRQKKQWKSWIKQELDLTDEDMVDNELGDEMLMSYYYTSRARIISLLRVDLCNKKISDEDQSIDLETIMEDLFKLHCAVDIKFTAEDKYNITYGIVSDESDELAEPESEKPAPKARKARAPKKAEATA